MTKTEVMARHGIASVAPLERWCREYRAGGPEALRPRPKGRPKGAKSKPRPKPTREQELTEQVAYLKAKVAYLEKLRPCGRRSHETREKRRRPTARGADTAVACGLQIWLWPVLFIDVFSWRFYDDCLQG